MDLTGSGHGPGGRVLPTRILCVDDNVDAADTTALLLILSGFDAHSCYDGVSALGELAAFRPQICLIDLNMPGMDGDELADRIRPRCDPPPRLIAVTAMCDDASRTRIRAAGFELHLVKPVDPGRLVSVVKEPP